MNHVCFNCASELAVDEHAVNKRSVDEIAVAEFLVLHIDVYACPHMSTFDILTYVESNSRMQRAVNELAVDKLAVD